MKTSKKIIILVLMFGFGAMTFQSCETLQQLSDALLNLSRLQFKLGGVSNFSLAGINLSSVSSLSDFSLKDGVKLLGAFRRKVLLSEFVIEVLSINPNDGTGGTQKTISTLTSLESRLLIDGKPTVIGNIDSPLKIPGVGQATSIPIRISMDLYEFFGNKGYEGLIQLALAIGGKQGSSSRISLDAQPRVSTPYGDILYPERIKIVDKEFR